MEIGTGNPPLPTVAKKLREAFAELGATYIKLGQFIASAPSLFPQDFVDEMQLCLDQVRPIPTSTVRKILEKELGKPPEEIFSYFEETPLASASIAQVHAARTQTGVEIVLKVQRPDIKSVLNTDMNLIQALAWVFEKFAPQFRSSGLAEMFEEFRKSILEEVDFQKEAENIREFENILLRSHESRAVVPKVYPEYSTDKVLAMERLFGSPITDEPALRKLTSDPKKILETALEIWFSSLATTGFFHADVHAGNLLILRDQRIGFIDFGIVGRISPRVWDGLMLFLQGMGFGDAESVADGLIQMDSTHGEVNRKQLVLDLDSVFQDLFSLVEEIQTGKVAEIDDQRLNRILFDIKGISEKNGLKIPKEFALLLKQILYFDRYVKALAPEIDLIRDQKKYIQDR